MKCVILDLICMHGAGFDSSELMLLESRVTYSLSKEKSAARFYIVQCPRFDTNQIAPLKFLVDRLVPYITLFISMIVKEQFRQFLLKELFFGSLQGPLAENFCGSWVTTTLVEYFHVLPYLVFIESWLPRYNAVYGLLHRLVIVCYL